MSKLEGRTAGDKLNKRSRAQCSDLITGTNRKPMQMLQQTVHIGRHIDDRFRAERKTSTFTLYEEALSSL